MKFNLLNYGGNMAERVQGENTQLCLRLRTWDSIGGLPYGL